MDVAELGAELGIDLDESKRLRALTDEVFARAVKGDPQSHSRAIIEAVLRAYALGRDVGFDEGVCK